MAMLRLGFDRGDMMGLQSWKLVIDGSGVFDARDMSNCVNSLIENRTQAEGLGKGHYLETCER